MSLKRKNEFPESGTQNLKRFHNQSEL